MAAGTRWKVWFAMLALSGAVSAAEPASPPSELEAELQRLKERHDAMQRNLERQQQALDEILRRASALAEDPAAGVPVSPAASAATPAPLTTPPPAESTLVRDERPLRVESSAGPVGNSTRPLRLGGHVAIAARRAERSGRFEGNSLRVDEVRLQVTGEITPRVLASGELEALTRERYKRGMRAGELYLEVAPFGVRTYVRLRAGRIDVPFGREHLRRDATENPLISHSAADIRGIDEGVQLQGLIGRWDWALALQNGHHRPAANLLAARTQTLRIGYLPAPHLRLGASALRTARLPQIDGEGGPLWVANIPLRRLPGSTAHTVRAGGLTADIEFSWRGGRVAAEAGAVRYEDDDPRRAIRRELPFLSLEGVQQLGAKSIVAARYSRISTAAGFHFPGDGRADDSRLTVVLERFSVGVGYVPVSGLNLKLEHSLNFGRRVGGAERTDENQTAAEAVLRF